MMKNTVRRAALPIAALAAAYLLPAWPAMAFPPDCVPNGPMAIGDVCQAPATKYLFNIVRFGFEKADGTILYFGNSLAFDAASVTAGQTVAGYLSGIQLPPGTYVAVRPIISISQTVAADPLAINGGATICSEPLPGTTQNRVDNGAHVCAGANDFQCTENGTFRVRDTSLGSFTVDANTNLSIRIDFDVSHGMNYKYFGVGNCRAAIGDLVDGPIGHLIPTLTLQ
jgi:hypothetical protein